MSIAASIYSSFAAGQVQPFTATYTVSLNGISVGRMFRQLDVSADREFTFTSTTKATGLVAVVRKESIVERSRWREDQGVATGVDYLHQRTRGKQVRERAIQFDPTNATAVTRYQNGATAQTAAPPGTADRLSYQAYLMDALAAGATSLQFEVVDGATTKLYEFDVIATETLSTAAGDLDVLRLERRVSTDGKRTTIWCASALGYLPVRVDSTEEGDTTSVVLVKTSLMQ
ncbi:MAG: DUF3108 domain-containing protein [Gammaproteobacteria bacterium]|nr:DUF3108 domain-containing protein [Gammaproteobacteria bacterium]